jgi:hypothetical protein
MGFFKPRATSPKGISITGKVTSNRARNAENSKNSLCFGLELGFEGYQHSAVIDCDKLLRDAPTTYGP